MLTLETVQSIPERMTQSKVLIPTDVDAFGRWRVWDILASLQRLTADHADAMRSGSRHLAKVNLAWVLGRIRIHMQRYPRCGETISITTWPGQPRRLFYPRHYDLRDATGAPLGWASTMWAVINIIKRTAVTLESGGVTYDIPPENPDLPRPARIRLPEAWQSMADCPIGYCDLDNNGHVNNLRYAEWVLDRLPWTHYRDHVFSDFQIDYSLEVLPDTPLQLGWETDAEHILAAGISGEHIMFSASGAFRPPVHGE